MNENTKKSLTQILDSLLSAAEGKAISIKKILDVLAGKGYPLIIAVLTIPFCLPIQIPGLSTPFGIVIAILALRMVFAHHRWWPQAVLKKEIPYESLESIVSKSKALALRMQKYIHPRLVMIVENRWLYKLHGIVICLGALVLALPLPIPLSNLLAGYSIIFIALGLLEEDGLFIILGYLVALICTIYLLVVIPYGVESLYELTHR